MTLFWCAVALVQAVFLPGYLVTRALRLDEGFVKTWVCSFGISLLLNYHLVLLFTLTHLTARSSVCGVVGIELVTLAWMLRRPRPEAASPGEASRLTRFLSPGGSSGGVSPARLALLLAGIAPLLYFASFVPDAFSTVFVGYDALVSYNRWALDWTHGLLPAWTMHYPQLLPATWSLIYTVVGAELQFLPKGLSLLFPVTCVLMLVDLGLRRNRGEYLLAAALTGLLIDHSGGRYVASGYVDLPVMFFGLAPFYLLGSCEADADGTRVRRHIAAAVACVAGCALTKQAGIFIAFVFPFLLAFDLRGRSKTALGVDVPRTLAAVVGVLLLLIVPWHAYKEIEIRQGLETWERAAQVQGNRTYPERLVWAWKIWELELSAPLAIATTLSIGLSLAAKRARVLTLAITLPFAIIWALFFSYDRRNLSLAFPFIGISAGAGAYVARDRLAATWRRLGPGGRSGACAGLFAILALVTLLRVGDRPLEHHDRELRRLGSPDLNAFLYEYAEEHGFEGEVLTNYRLMSNLPELRDHVYFDRNAPAGDFWPFRDPASFERVLKKRLDSIRYVVVLRPADLKILDFLKRGIDAGKLQVLYRTEVGLVIRIPERP